MVTVMAAAATTATPTITPINMYRFIHEASMLAGDILIWVSLVTVPEGPVMTF